ncbi:hypothetical protein ACTXT7_014302 [Hymenolepis weldensis]
MAKGKARFLIGVRTYSRITMNDRRGVRAFSAGPRDKLPLRHVTMFATAVPQTCTRSTLKA